LKGDGYDGASPQLHAESPLVSAQDGFGTVDSAAIGLDAGSALTNL